MYARGKEVNGSMGGHKQTEWMEEMCVCVRHATVPYCRATIAQGSFYALGFRSAAGKLAARTDPRNQIQGTVQDAICLFLLETWHWATEGHGCGACEAMRAGSEREGYFDAHRGDGGI